MLFDRRGGVILEAHERRSRLPLLHRQPSKHAKRMVALLAAVPPVTRRSVSFDNGSEFSEHRKLSDQLGMATYFCDPRSPWQKGGVENAVGRLRRWLPQELDQIVLGINLTPRKCLDFRTPLEIFFGTNVSLGIALGM